MSFSIRAMRYEDITAVQDIERKVFPTPWTRATFEREVVSPAYHRLIVAEVDEQIVGYACFFFVLDEGHITNIGVEPDCQFKGIGTRLMFDLLSFAIRKGIKKLLLEVRPTNKVAQHLYRKFGFFMTGVRKGYYTDTGEDAFIFQTGDITSPQYTILLNRISREIEEAA